MTQTFVDPRVQRSLHLLACNVLSKYLARKFPTISSKPAAFASNMAKQVLKNWAHLQCLQ
jgi:hypothetical protein